MRGDAHGILENLLGHPQRRRPGYEGLGLRVREKALQVLLRAFLFLHYRYFLLGIGGGV